MSESTLSRFNVTAEEILPLLESEEWGPLPLTQLAKTFRHLAYGEGKDPDAPEGRVYRLLSAATSFLPNFAATGNPFGSCRHNLQGPGTRSYMAEDLTEADIDALEGIVSELLNPELQARIADVIWECRKKSHTTGQTAIRAYLASADRLKTTGPDHLRYTEYLERAAQLAQKMNRKGELYQEVIRSIKIRIQAIPVTSATARVCGQLLAILIRHKAADADTHAHLAESYAQLLNEETFYDEAVEFWDLAALIYKADKKTDQASRCEKNAAESAVALAEKLLERRHLADLHTVALMQQALVRLREAKVAKKRIDEIHHRLLAMQAQLPEQLQTIEIDLDEIPGFMEARKASHEQIYALLSPLSFKESIAYLATHIFPTNYQGHRASTLKIMADSPLLSVIDTVQFDHTGKTADTMEADPLGDSEEMLKMRMLVSARETLWPITVDFQIEPARQAIIEKHNVRLHDLAFLVTNNSFVKRGREELYLRGIQAGFYGDWPLATHFLIPQLEESVRQIIQLKGGITSTFKSGVQMERDMNEILWTPEAEEAFGLNVLFDLRGILIEQWGYNLRNKMAHGLMDADDFFSVPSVYLWWLTIRLCWHGHCIAIAVQQQEEQEEGGSAE
jgi:hypothetical protein